MRRVPAHGPLPRSAALIALAALLVHQLRYLLAYGSTAGDELAHQGHGYLDQLVPVLIGFALALLAACLVRAVFGWGPLARPLAGSFAARTLLYATAVLIVFCTQELLEGVAFAGHPAGTGAVLAGGGWLAMPLAALAGALAALLDRGLVAVERIIEGRMRSLEQWRPPRSTGAARPPAIPPLASAPLAFGLSRRPPPFSR
jgi:hypothetical protein